MSSFIGGSPNAMVRDIGEGYILLTKPKLKRYTLNDLTRLKEELEKTIRSLRGTPPTSGDPVEIKKHNRKIMRLNAAGRILQQEILVKKRGR